MTKAASIFRDGSVDISTKMVIADDTQEALRGGEREINMTMDAVGME